MKHVGAHRWRVVAGALICADRVLPGTLPIEGNARSGCDIDDLVEHRTDKRPGIGALPDPYDRTSEHGADRAHHGKGELAPDIDDHVVVVVRRKSRQGEASGQFLAYVARGGRHRRPGGWAEVAARSTDRGCVGDRDPPRLVALRSDGRDADQRPINAKRMGEGRVVPEAVLERDDNASARDRMGDRFDRDRRVERLRQHHERVERGNR